jgi:hypothetical protein
MAERIVEQNYENQRRTFAEDGDKFSVGVVDGMTPCSCATCRALILQRVGPHVLEI